MTQTRPKQDFGFVTIVTLVVVVVMWLLLTPILPAVSLATMRRFHLGSQSFVGWAAQFPIPSMYNFPNTYEVRDLPPDLFVPIDQEQKRIYLNHFPCRVVTFADGRYHHLRNGQDRWFTFTTNYRGQYLESRWFLKRVGEKFVLRRLSVQDSPR